MPVFLSRLKVEANRNENNSALTRKALRREIRTVGFFEQKFRSKFPPTSSTTNNERQFSGNPQSQ